MTTSLEIKNLKAPGEAKVVLDAFSKITKGKIKIITPEKMILEYHGTEAGPEVELTLYDWKVLSEVLNKSDIGLAETYFERMWDVSNISDLLEFAIINEDALKDAFKGNWAKILFYRIKHEASENTKIGSKKNIKAHYDLGNAFYSLWLDKTMTYSSAIFKNGQESLEEAQNNKYQSMLDLIGAKKTDHILEVGCGWGGFIEYACQKGYRVTGITISDEQYAFAKERIKKNNLEDRADVLLCDYRDLKGQYDHAVSIEMIEAVGEKYWDSYFELYKRVLKPNAKFAVQAILMSDENFESYRKGTDFIQQHVFPGGMLLSTNTIKKLCATHKYELEDMIYFGLDYGKTLNIWAKDFNAQLDKVKSLGFDDRFIRLWNFYLGYCEGAFKAKRIDVVQFLVSV